MELIQQQIDSVTMKRYLKFANISYSRNTINNIVIKGDIQNNERE